MTFCSFDTPENLIVSLTCLFIDIFCLMFYFCHFISKEISKKLRLFATCDSSLSMIVGIYVVRYVKPVAGLTICLHFAPNTFTSDVKSVCLKRTNHISHIFPLNYFIREFRNMGHDACSQSLQQVRHL